MPDLTTVLEQLKTLPDEVESEREKIRQSSHLSDEGREYELSRLQSKQRASLDQLAAAAEAARKEARERAERAEQAAQPVDAALVAAAQARLRDLKASDVALDTIVERAAAGKDRAMLSALRTEVDYFALEGGAAGRAYFERNGGRDGVLRKIELAEEPLVDADTRYARKKLRETEKAGRGFDAYQRLASAAIDGQTDLGSLRMTAGFATSGSE